MRKLAIVAVLGLAVILAAGCFLLCPRARPTIPMKVVEAYKQWQSRFGRLRSSPEEANFRLSVFHKNYLMVEDHNLSDQSFKMALNQFADMTDEEFSAQLTNIPQTAIEGVTKYEPEPKSLAQSATFDYKNYLPFPYITGSSTCNDNYAWISAVNMNSNYYMQKNQPMAYKFSPQTYLDCSANFGNQGCNGGWASFSFKFSQQWGIDTLDDYPYVGYLKACRATTGYFKNTGIMQITENSNTQLLSSLQGKRMISVGIDITGAKFYSSGVFKGTCTVKPNQNMLLFGAGIDPKSQVPYWLLLNTWGQLWGEGGYMRLFRSTNDGAAYNSCGITTSAFFPSF